QAVPLAGGRAEERLRPGLALGEDRRQALIVLRGTPHPRRLLPDEPPEATVSSWRSMSRSVRARVASASELIQLSMAGAAAIIPSVDPDEELHRAGREVKREPDAP